MDSLYKQTEKDENGTKIFKKKNISKILTILYVQKVLTTHFIR